VFQGFHQYWNKVTPEQINARKSFRRAKCITYYQKAVKLKKLGVVAMEAIDPAAKTNCDILRAKARRVPGVPGKSFIFPSKSRILNGYGWTPIFIFDPKVKKKRKLRVLRQTDEDPERKKGNWNLGWGETVTGKTGQGNEEVRLDR